MNRNGIIDLCKFLFIFVIVLYHSNNFSEGETFIFPGGSIFVEFFFIVSGYLMVASAERRLKQCEAPISIGDETQSFLWRKVKGLLPDLIIAWVAAFAVTNWIKADTLYEVARNGANSIFDFFLLSQSGLVGFRANGAAWYLSAMILAMAILYPFLIKNSNTFLKVVAPLLCLFLYGYMYKTWSLTFVGPSIWVGFATKGMLRAIAGLCLGCLCYVVSRKLQGIRPTKFFTGLLSLVEYGSYLAVLGISFIKPHSQLDFVLLVLMAVGITISFSQQGGITKVLAKVSAFTWLGAFSLDLYLSHGFWANAMTKMFPDLTYWQIMPYYLAISFATGIAIMLISNLIKNNTRLWPGVKRIFIVSEKSTESK